MTELDLTAIKARAEAATEGPWHIIGGNEYVTGIGVGIGPDDGVTQADAEFIANARTDVPALVAEVERLRWIEVGAREAGRIIDRLYEAQRPVIDAAGLGHLLADDGDGDWEQVWELLAQIVAAASEEADRG